MFVFVFLLTCQCGSRHCKEPSLEQHLPLAAFASPTKQTNKKDVYTQLPGPLLSESHATNSG